MLGIDDEEAVSTAMAQAVETQFAPSQEEAEEKAREDEETDEKLDKAFGVQTAKPSLDEKLDKAFGLNSPSDKEAISRSARKTASRGNSSLEKAKKLVDKVEGRAK